MTTNGMSNLTQDERDRLARWANLILVNAGVGREVWMTPDYGYICERDGFFPNEHWQQAGLLLEQLDKKNIAYTIERLPTVTRVRVKKRTSFTVIGREHKDTREAIARAVLAMLEAQDE